MTRRGLFAGLCGLLGIGVVSKATGIVGTQPPHSILCQMKPDEIIELPGYKLTCGCPYSGKVVFDLSPAELDTWLPCIIGGKQS